MNLLVNSAARIIAAKTLLDIGATIAFIFQRDPKMAILLAGYALADIGAWWLAISP